MQIDYLFHEIRGTNKKLYFFYAILFKVIWTLWVLKNYTYKALIFNIKNIRKNESLTQEQYAGVFRRE